MNVMITNDDGIYAKGIDALVKGFSTKGHKVFVVAPERERSAVSQAITLHKPLRIHRVDKWDGVEAYAVNGTPTDCSKLGLTELIKEPVDLVVSGINRGPNLGTDVLYSGTVSAAIEATIIGVPAIAISLVGHEQLDYTFAAQIAEKLAVELLKQGVPKDTLLNVNVPNLPKTEIKGIAITSLGQRRYNKLFHRREDPRGNVYYWMVGEAQDYIEDKNTDVAKIKENYITISPIHFDFTKYNLMNMLENWELDQKLL
ncbi:5'-nucleotidase /3'-nucleotidase /exopolyphosphatase [Anaerobranca californiensis DSM 14826]|jgi:5'-nucleotidase|uniref:5'-nucleotidase SurE n=1 Tax=Anaerobranca californiensis DSM 14826 TaxID=1120989 RepID=A0A1M6N8R9_9FIRM|nr:5'/3'-nucleotidase SurE [Anaerobranca californiensis]SHJ92130.1 5'-nucleotidase /3'-nucleotidase /exopolyphosphatase [Anaerobranca californiensis DSM 14826]